jgi:hypothetical protein
MFQEFATKAAAQGSLFNEDTQLALLQVLADLNPAFKELYETLKKMVSIKGSTGGSGGKSIPYQHGGTIWAGGIGTVGEAGEEKIKPYFTSEIIPIEKFDPWQHGIILPTMDKGGKGAPILLTINIGGRTLKQIILESVDKEIDIQ